MKSQVRARLRKNRMIAIITGIAAVCFCIIMLSKIFNINDSNQDLKERKARLEEQLKSQEDREAELNADENYVKTIDYIEEKARSIGYVYPDEIIFQKED